MNFTHFYRQTLFQSSALSSFVIHLSIILALLGFDSIQEIILSMLVWQKKTNNVRKHVFPLDNYCNVCRKEWVTFYFLATISDNVWCTDIVLRLLTHFIKKHRNVTIQIHVTMQITLCLVEKAVSNSEQVKTGAKIMRVSRAIGKKIWRWCDEFCFFTVHAF